MELLQPLDPLLANQFFVGFESNDTVAAGVIGCDQNNAIIHSYLQYYQGKHFFRDGEAAITTSPVVFTDILKELGFVLNGKKQCISDFVTYPKEVFYPTGIGWVLGRYGKNTIGVHHYMDSWGKNGAQGQRSLRSKLRLSMLFHARNLFGTDTMYEIGQMLRKIKSHM